MREFGKYVHTITERAASEAQEAGSPTIEAEHLLLAIAAEEESTSTQVLRSVGLDYQTIRHALDNEFRRSLTAAGVTVKDDNLPERSRPSQRPSLMGTSAKRVVERGVATVRRKNDLQPAHLLLGVLQLERGTVPRALALAGIDREDLTARLRQLLPSTGTE